MFYVDSHIHLQDYTTQDVNNIVTAAKKNKVQILVNASAHPQDWDKVAQLAAQYPFIIPAYGVHPWHIADAPDNWLAKLKKMLEQNPRAWVGECGIDRLKNSNIDAQLKILEPQTKLAREFRRPLIIHSVKADEILVKLFPMLPKRTIFHSFTGSAEWGKKIQSHGFFIGLNFSVLHKKNAAQIIQSLNFSQILLETDGPYQSGTPNKETLPQNLPLLAEQIAALKQISVDELMMQLMQNWQNFYGEL